MSLRSSFKHFLHCLLLFLSICVCYYLNDRAGPGDQTMDYGTITTFALYVQQYTFLLSLPVVFLMFMGLVFYNAFPDEVKLKTVSKRVPFICIRTVTRGSYPELVLENVNRNMKTCFDAGLEDFVMEVVTDKKVGLPPYPRVREIVVPASYRTKNGTLYKARALQYCLEESSNSLSDEDWIVHLDEETVMTPDSVRGIINFVLDGKHQLGQGVITYANEKVVNWMTTLFDATRVADDYGILKFQLKAFHRLLLSWKGSFLVIQAVVERKITFDHGPRGSVTEDINFGMMSVANGYTFDFIEGEMWEKSPFSISDFIKQRKRWSQGSILITTNEKVPYRAKFLFCYATWVSLTLPFAVPGVVIAMIFPVPCGFAVSFLRSIIYGVFSYTFVFGVLRSFNYSRLGFVKYSLCILGSCFILPSVKLVLDTIAILYAVFSTKVEFHIVDKEIASSVGDSYVIV